MEREARLFERERFHFEGVCCVAMQWFSMRWGIQFGYFWCQEGRKRLGGLRVEIEYNVNSIFGIDASLISAIVQGISLAVVVITNTAVFAITGWGQ